MADKVFGISMQDQRIKYLLVAILAAVLVAVIAWPGDAPPTDSRAVAAGVRPNSASHRSAPASSKAAPAVNSAAKTAGKKSRPRPNVSAVSEDELEMTLSFNPFAPRNSVQSQLAGETTISQQEAQEEAAEKARALAVEQRLSEFRGQKISIVLRMSDGASAVRIGKRLIQEGEVVDGIRVLSISAEGIIVEPVTSP